MSSFDTAPAKTGDSFVRHDPSYLNMIYGTEKKATPQCNPPVSSASLNRSRWLSSTGQDNCRQTPAKTFGMHSISNGYVYTQNEGLLERFKKTADSLYLTHGNAFITFATIAAYKKGDAWVDELLAYLQGTIEWIQDFLNSELPVITMPPVEGTYQVWLDCSATGLPGDVLKAALGASGFGATPGTWFDEDASQFIRVNIAAPRIDIESAFRAFKAEIDRTPAVRVPGVMCADSADTSGC